MSISIVGVISDTHGHLPEKALDVFRGDYSEAQVLESLFIDGSKADLPSPRAVDVILHAGDIGELTPLSQDVIDALESIAPVYAVLGNRDVDGYRANGALVSEQLLTVELCGVSVAVMHKPEDLTLALRAVSEKPRVLVHGHTHLPKLQRRGSGLMLCPGSIHKPKGDWPRRTVALLYLEDPGKVIGAQVLKI